MDKLEIARAALTQIQEDAERHYREWSNPAWPIGGNFWEIAKKARAALAAIS